MKINLDPAAGIPVARAALVGKESAGAKAQFILLALSARLKSCPDTKPWKFHVEASFSAACKA